MQTPDRESQKVSFFGLTADGFDAVVVGWGWPKFRAQQVREWVYGRLVADPQLMTNLSKADRQLLADRVEFATATVTRQQASSDGTRKLLLTWPAGAKGEATAETVMIPDADRRTACVSSQVGCPVGCKFCASGINGVKGNLTAAQIVEQIFQLNRMLKGELGGGAPGPSARAENRDGPGQPESDFLSPREKELGPARSASLPHPSGLTRRSVSAGARGAARGEDADRITNIVFMGMGEPLANYANVMGAIRVLHDPKCFNLGARRITISTVGVPPKMRDLAAEKLPLNLAISLHAPNEPLRKRLIPWAEHFALSDILNAARHYFDRTGREVTLEYILLSGVNDRPEHARELARLCKTLRANVNLIRYNEVAGLPFGRPKGEDVVRFQEILRTNGVNAHVRKSRGRDIDAACGQLRRKEQEKREREERQHPPPQPQLVALGVPTATPEPPLMG